MTSNNSDFDVVIVGSGPAGSAVAREIHDLNPAARVLMLEAGPQLSDPPGRHLRTIVDEVQRKLAQRYAQGPDQYDFPPMIGPPVSSGGRVPQRPGLFLLGETAVHPGEDGMPAAAMASGVGGMGAQWSCACPAPGGSEVIDFLPKDEFDADFARAHELFSVTSHAFDGAPLSDELRRILGGLYDDGRPDDRRVQPMPLAIELGPGRRYWAGTDVILGDLITGAANFELRAETVASRIITDENGRAISVETRDRNTGEVVAVPAQFVVVAGDALRTPQLLFASGIRPRALGRYLNDQPQVVALVRLADELIPEGASDQPFRAEGQVEQFSGVTWIPFNDVDFPFHGQIVQMDAGPIPIDAGKVWPGSVVGIGLFGCKDLQEDDRVEFSESETDWLGLPKMSIHYTLTRRDHATIEAMVDEATRMTDAIGSALDDGPIRLAAGSSLHYQGSVRMGPSDDGTSVCDTHGRVWGTANVYVAGNGVIPTATACNPTATAVALAIRTARRIAETVAPIPEEVSA